MPEACNFIKNETPAQVFSFEFCETFKNTFFYSTPPVTASVFSCRTLFKFHFVLFNIKKYVKWTKDNHKSEITLITVNLFHFDIL